MSSLKFGDRVVVNHKYGIPDSPLIGQQGTVTAVYFWEGMNTQVTLDAGMKIRMFEEKELDKVQETLAYGGESYYNASGGAYAGEDFYPEIDE